MQTKTKTEPRMRVLLREFEPEEVGRSPMIVDTAGGWEEWNKLINADYGEIVRCPNGDELWCDDSGLINGRPLNPLASMLAGQPIHGDALLFEPGDIK